MKQLFLGIYGKTYKLGLKVSLTPTSYEYSAWMHESFKQLVQSLYNSTVFKTIDNEARKTIYMTPHKRAGSSIILATCLFIMPKIFVGRKEQYVSLQQELNEYIKKNGLKKSFVADELGMKGSKLSNFLHGKLLMTDEVESKVRTYLDQKK